MTAPPLRIAYLDCFAGISGDMFLGALLHAGVPAEVLESSVEQLGIGASLRMEPVLRSGIAATRVFVLDNGRLADGPEPHAHPHLAAEDAAHPRRSLADITRILEGATLPAEVRAMALDIFTQLAEAEARIHGVTTNEVHFHEVGAVDAMADIVAACAGIHHLQIDAWHCSAVNVGSGMVTCAHGLLPVPAPATAALLQGVPTYAAHLEKELTTPTGAAILRALRPSFGPRPLFTTQAVGYGAGKRNPENFPNVLRLTIGTEPAADALPAYESSAEEEIVTVLETAVDDLSPQVTAYAAEAALASGALDVMLTPVIMKKGRPGTLVTVLCRPADSQALQALLFRETSTFGIRVRQDRRTALTRRFVVVATEYGPIRMKVGEHAGLCQHAAPEMEDCRAAAARHQVPLKTVQAAALAAFANAEGTA